jgi:hypothetical protein
MATVLSFNVEGGDRTLQGLAALDTALKDLRPFWRDVFAPKYFGVVQDLFATGGRARGGGGRFKSGAWAPLSPAYREWKKKHFPGQPILVRSGDLRESVRWDGARLGAGGQFDAQPGFVIAGTTIPYGKHHQNGAGKMPKREFLPSPDPAVFAPLLAAWLIRNTSGVK